MNTPEIRFPEFYEEWQSTKLGKYFERLTQVSTIQDQHPVLTSARNGLIRQDKYFEESRLGKRPNIGFNVILNHLKLCNNNMHFATMIYDYCK